MYDYLKQMFTVSYGVWLFLLCCSAVVLGQVVHAFQLQDYVLSWVVVGVLLCVLQYVYNKVCNFVVKS